jgi:antirestriction protein ArdC
MPEQKQFDSDEAYYTTLFHELVHSTGSEKRLKRLEPALFGSDPYAREELVAEVGASFLSGIAGFESAGGDQSAAYLAGWLERIKNDPKLVVQAAAQAQKAADLILNITFQDEPANAGSTLVAA